MSGKERYMQITDKKQEMKKRKTYEKIISFKLFSSTFIRTTNTQKENEAKRKKKNT